MVKENAFHVIESQTDAARLVGALLAMELDQDLYGALVEVITSVPSRTILSPVFPSQESELQLTLALPIPQNVMIYFRVTGARSCSPSVLWICRHPASSCQL